MCGEYSNPNLFYKQGMGSPPHVWRIQLIYPFRPQLHQDHLHMCGEYHFDGFIIKVFLGSPPHVWRILPRCPVQNRIEGITSTYVENTVNKSLYSAK